MISDIVATLNYLEKGLLFVFLFSQLNLTIAIDDCFVTSGIRIIYTCLLYLYAGKII